MPGASMTTYATKNPLGSVDPRDLYDNSQNFDSAINDLTSPVWQDRFGKSRHTWYGLESMAKTAIAAYGYIPMDSFQAGANLTKPNEVLRDTSTGEYYRWDGTFPKTVPAGSTPESAGGTGAGKWLSVGDAVLRGQLANPNIGDALVAVIAPFTNSVARTQHDVNTEFVSIKNWPAKGDGIADDTAAIQTACNDLLVAFAVDGIQRTLVFPDGQYMTSDTIVEHPNMRILCIGRVVFQNKTTNKTFAAFELQGGAKKTTLGTIDSYGGGFVIRGNTHDVEFHTISNCVDACVLRADINWTLGSKNNLDNKITGVQIGKCTNAIVFEQNGDSLVQQGNEIRVNFVSETNNSVVFRNYGGFTHTKQSNWDSNFIELAASDPLTLPDSSMIRNTTGFAVPNLTFRVTSWCGGWTANAGTICLVRGQFTAGRFMFNLASNIGLNEVVDASSKSAFGSCEVNLCRHSNLGSGTSFYTAVAPGASFNGGVAVQNDKFKVRVSVPDLAPGQVYGSSFWHVLVQRSETSRMHLEQVNGAPQARNGLLLELADAGTEQIGMVRIWVRNIGSATTTARDIDFVVSAS